jgi:hypothetical protein
LYPFAVLWYAFHIGLGDTFAACLLPHCLQLPGGGAPLQASGQFGSAFLLDVHMDSGRLLKPWVSSLGAFWPAMQALAGGCVVVVATVVGWGRKAVSCQSNQTFGGSTCEVFD